MPRIPVNQPYTITNTFGVPDSNALFKKHSGIDFAVPLNRPVYAPVSGQLTNVVTPTGGNMVRIYDGKYWHRLMHNNSFSRNNGPVNEGEQVAKAGTTGLSTGVHCHWDIANKQVPTSFSDFINPLEYIKNQGGTMSDKVTAAELPDMVRGYLFREPNADDNVHLGKTWQVAQSDFIHSPQRGAAQARYDSVPNLEAQVAQLTKENEELKKGFEPVSQLYVKKG